MDVVFGIQSRDGAIRAVVGDDEVDAFKKRLEAALAGDGDKVLWVQNKDGHEIAIPSEKIAFVEFGAEKSSRQVGFSSAG